VLLLHRWEHRARWHGAAWSRLLELKGKNVIRVVGASVYEPWEALEALQYPEIQLLQIPFNLLDWRWRTAELDKAIASRPDVVIHARSALLQGILIHGPELWPRGEAFDAGAIVDVMNSLVTELRRDSVADLCFAYVRSQSWIHGIVVGCETMRQLVENLRMFQLPPLDPKQSELVERSLPMVSDSLLNPAKWTHATQLQAACSQ